MREKIKTPVVIINKRETSDSYVVSVTDGSNNFHDGVLLVGVKPVEKNDRFAVFSMAGYYMAAEMQIVNLKQNCENDPRIHEIVDLKESVAELAAENVVMKELIEQHANSVAVCPNCSHEEPSETDDIVALYRSMETPATDAFLAEVRAHGVERYAAQLKSEAELADEAGWDGAAKFLISESEKVLAFAAQLRQETAQ
ncbi:hypothetical protein ABL037_004153 [Salmonella enterica]